MTATTSHTTGTTSGPRTPATGNVDRTGAERSTAPAETTRERATRYVFAGIRLALGWTFLWALLDKMFGLGHETAAKAAWINGGSPTRGFLQFGSAGPFKDLYQGIAGAWWADWFFMAGLAGLSFALLLGIGMRVAAVSGGLLFLMMWSVVLPPENNPFMDDHLIFAALLAGLALVNAGDTLGLGRFWARLPLVRRMPWLR